MSPIKEEKNNHFPCRTLIVFGSLTIIVLGILFSQYQAKGINIFGNKIDELTRTSINKVPVPSVEGISENSSMQNTRWERDTNECTNVVHFYSPNEFSVLDENKCHDDYTAKGTYKVVGNKITLSFTKIQGQSTNKKIEMIKTSNDSLASQDNDGNSQIYRRI